MNGEDADGIILSQPDDFITPASPKQNQDHPSWGGGN